MGDTRGATRKRNAGLHVPNLDPIFGCSFELRKFLRVDYRDRSLQLVTTAAAASPGKAASRRLFLLSG